MSKFPPVTHFAVTVSDLDRSLAWYEKLFDAEAFFVGDESSYRFAVWIDPSFALHQHHQPPDEALFSELRIGLDHIAFECSSREELEGWKTRLDELGVERGEIVDAFYGSGLAFRDLDFIQFEFFLPATSGAGNPLDVPVQSTDRSSQRSPLSLGTAMRQWSDEH